MDRAVERSVLWLSIGNSNTSSMHSFTITSTSWDVTLNISVPGNVDDYVVFGENYYASDGQDTYDQVKPPMPFPPYLYAWFDAGLSEPYNILWRDYRKYPDNFKVWNLSVLWASSSDNSTNITIQWNGSALLIYEYSSIVLKDVSANILVNMLTFSNYTYNASPLITYEFQVICSEEPVENNYHVSLGENWNIVS